MRTTDARRRKSEGSQSAGGERVRKLRAMLKAPHEPGASPENVIQFPVAMARGSHLFPYRTQKLSLYALMVLGWKRPGRVGRRRIPLGCWRSSPSPTSQYYPSLPRTRLPRNTVPREHSSWGTQVLGAQLPREHSATERKCQKPRFTCHRSQSPGHPTPRTQPMKASLSAPPTAPRPPPRHSSVAQWQSIRLLTEGL